MKTTQLQIRVTPAEKAEIERAARRAGLGMSAYVLGKLLPNQSGRWRGHLQDILKADDTRIPLAALSHWLANLAAGELAGALEAPPPASLPEHLANTVADELSRGLPAAQPVRGYRGRRAGVRCRGSRRKNCAACLAN